MSRNANLLTAQRIKNDEFFTQPADIEAELSHYKEHFKDRTVYCNCDHPDSSNFWLFFKAHFEDYGLKRLTATFKALDAYQATLERRNGCIALSRHRLVEGGDFRSPECLQLLRQADIVVTNPPFSLWREYMALLMGHQKAFLIIGPMNVITYKDVFPLLQCGKLWLGNTAVKTFVTPNGTVQKFGNVFWYTNLDCANRHTPMLLNCRYSPALYPRYVNYDAIEVGRIDKIPGDYTGAMGVPISFLTRYCPEQFKILGLSSTTATHIPKDLPPHLKGGIRFYLKEQDGHYRRMYERLVVQRK